MKELIVFVKVVPLSKRSGILEWVENSMQLGEYLCGSKGAHDTYNIGDMPTDKCRTEFRVKIILLIVSYCFHFCFLENREGNNRNEIESLQKHLQEIATCFS